MMFMSYDNLNIINVSNVCSKYIILNSCKRTMKIVGRSNNFENFIDWIYDLNFS